MNHRFVPTDRQAVHTLLLGFLGIAAAIPGRLQVSLRVASVPVRVESAALVALLGVFALAALIRPRHPLEPLGSGAPAAFTALCAYAVISMIWSDTRGAAAAGMAITLVLALSALWVAALALRFEPDPHRLLGRITVAVAAICTVYAGESFLGLGLRSAENTEWTDFGIQRLRGPLFGSSNGPFLVLPALGYALHGLLERRTMFRLCVALILFVSMLAMGSRSGLLSLGVFVLVSAVAIRSMRARAAFVAGTAVLGLVAGWTVFARATTERLASFEDELRATTHRSAISTVRDADLVVQLTGHGYGALWPWYVLDTTQEGARGAGDYLQHIPGGSTLYHPHSTVLLLGAELGVPGLMFFAALLWALFRALLRERRKLGGALVALAAVLASTATFGTDLLLFKSPLVNLVWWIYALGLLRLSNYPFHLAE